MYPLPDPATTAGLFLCPVKVSRPNAQGGDHDNQGSAARDANCGSAEAVIVLYDAPPAEPRRPRECVRRVAHVRAGMSECRMPCAPGRDSSRFDTGHPHEAPQCKPTMLTHPSPTAGLTHLACAPSTSGRKTWGAPEPTPDASQARHPSTTQDPQGIARRLLDPRNGGAGMARTCRLYQES